MRTTLIFVVALMACSSAPDAELDAGADSGVDAGWVNPDGGIPTGDCQADHGIIANATHAIIQPHTGPCAVDNDCVLIERSVTCSSYCPAAVLADGGAELRAEIVAYGASVCPFVACQGAGLCPAYEAAVCHQGTCRRGFADGGVAE